MKSERIAVIFDLDGTLVDSWQLAQDAFAHAFREKGLDGKPPLERFKRHLGRPLEEILAQLELPAALKAPFVSYANERAHQVRPFSGVVAALEHLNRAGILVGIVTAKDRARVERVLAINGLQRFFAALVTADDAPGKPRPEAIWECQRQLGALCNRAAYVGDTLLDMQTARNASVTAVFAAWGSLDELLPGDYDIRVDKPQQLAAIFL